MQEYNMNAKWFWKHFFPSELTRKSNTANEYPWTQAAVV